MAEQTYLERLIEETIRPVLGALVMLKEEMAETLDIPDAPWKILNKPYSELTEQEIMALFDIYHVPGESSPCPMCSWMARVEMSEARKNKKELGG